MEDEYDIVILGTGLKECILSGLMSVSGKKVLHIDRNKYYGGETASITPLDELYSMFEKGKAPEHLGRQRDWNVDLIPKFLMAQGKLVKLLVCSKVTNYVKFKCIEGSYVFKGSNIHKVPSNATEALSTSLMGLFEKRRFKKLLVYVVQVDEENTGTWEGFDIMKNDTKALFAKFGVDKNTIDMVGHAICLHLNDDYFTDPAVETIRRMKLYNESLATYGKSPYLYPMYGIGDLPQGFARLSALYGGLYMLDKPIDEIVFGEDGKACGVRSGEEVVKCKAVICDPSYYPEKCREEGKVIRAICIMKHPVPNTNNAKSTQIIIPQNQIGRKNDIYVCVVSADHEVAAKGHFIALVATTVETDNPHNELKPGIDLLGPVEQIFYKVSPYRVPIDEGIENRVFVTKSYDATTHFETTCRDVLDIWKRFHGEAFDFSTVTEQLGVDDCDE